MNKAAIKLYNVVDNSDLPEMIVDKPLTDGDPLEIKGEMYYVCETNSLSESDTGKIGLIPLVVRNPRNVQNINNYLKCLSIAHRKVQFMNEKGMCDLGDCNEMTIT